MSIEAISRDSAGTITAHGTVAASLLKGGPQSMARRRIFVDTDGTSCINVYKGDVHGDGRTNPKNWKAEPAAYHGITAYGTLRRDEWLQLDKALMGVRDYRLGGVQDLLDRGLTYDLNGMGTTVFEYHDVGDAFETQMSMDALSRGPGDRLEFKSVYLPLPIIYVDFDINERVLQSSRNLGSPLDTSSVERAGRRVAESVERLLFSADDAYSYGGGTIHSYLTHPQRNQVSGNNVIAWNNNGKTPKGIIDDVLAWKLALIEDRFYGPYMLYIPTKYETLLDADYDAQTPGTTIRERIMKISNIEGIKVIDTLPDNNIVMVQLTSDTVRLIRGMEMQILEWGDEGGLSTHYKVMTIQVPQVRATQAGRSGVLHVTLTP